MNNEGPSTIFFLGAGASVRAGVPDTHAFVNEFTSHLRDLAKKESIVKIVEILKEWKGSEIDVELLLETLTKLANKEKEPLLQFYENQRFILGDAAEKEPLINDLKDFIKQKAIVAEDNIKYLQPLLGFIEEQKPLQIISVNYDTCIEQFANVNKLVCQDGFDVNWNPTVYSSVHNDINLYKMHGSIVWYQTDRGGYVKVPIESPSSRIRLITGEEAQNLMLYPMQKVNYSEPLLELSLMIKRMIESERCEQLIVIGYSFRDEHIRQMLWDAARRNKRLKVLLVDPNAMMIYEDNLRFYDGNRGIPSSLDGRVICLPYLAEGILPILRNNIVKELRQALRAESELHEKEREGQVVNWVECVGRFASAEYVDKVDHHLNEVTQEQCEYGLRGIVPIYLKVGCNLLLCGNNEGGDEYLNKFDTVLETVLIERLDIDVGQLPNKVGLRFNVQPFPHNASYFYVKTMREFISEMLFHVASRVKMVKVVPKRIRDELESLSRIVNYLEGMEDNMDMESYVLRREQESEIPEELLVVHKNAGDLRKVLLGIESDLLRKVFKGKTS